MDVQRLPDADGSDGERIPVPFGIPRRTWAGRGSGGPCDLCHQIVQPHQVEYEVELVLGNLPRVLHLHFECYQEWALNARRAGQ
jgi:hypothetical protein